MNARSLVVFVVRRLAVLPLLLLAISFGVFSLTYLAPGSPEAALLGGRSATPEALAAIRAQYGLDKPFLEQYTTWLGNAIQLDFGRSIRSGEPVVDAIQRRANVTIFLTLYAFTITALLGIPLGVLAAVRKRSLADRAIVAGSVIGVSAPAFATGIILLYLFAIVLGWFPVFGQGEGWIDQLWHYALPALTLALTVMALIVKLTRTATIEALDQDYVTFARARGISGSRVLTSYALRNALVPVITASGIVLGYMLTGAVLVEVTFALPGIGSLLVQSAAFQDVPTIQGIAMLIAVMIVLVNLVTDVLYAVVDPRIRFGAVEA
jgi:peptide/nickel transport system permease protein